MTRAAKAWLGFALAVTGIGLVYGFLRDIWGWWWLSLGAAAVGLWLVWRDPVSPHRLLAKRALTGLTTALALLAIGAIAFVIWFSSFEF